MKRSTFYTRLAGVVVTATVLAGLTVPLVATAENQSMKSAQIARSEGRQAGGGNGDTSDHSKSESAAADRDRSRDQDQDRMRDQDQDRIRDRDRTQEMVQSHIQTMDQLHDRIQQTQAPDQRQKLMEQYREQIRESLQLMNEAWPTAAGKDGAGIVQMQHNQEMQRQLMQHMWNYQELQPQ